ncbi:type III secretion system translocon subunit SctB [Parendozoicomonas haliclonae]|uniref:Uncharacterized protein n=1 Tax=Parendozoicomonas haliclonae TaxID=1960125 RepID=A0A1X7AFT0_9GAMM|nr:type III secretion system translocon subunit SctB [Parendozoicomonas haliclonae]SMA36161.1 hypothetical protein EHSB41UT_00604 [Parendozoicomonas haliclonae]
MGVRIDQGQGSVPLDRPNVGVDMPVGKVAKGSKAGNLSGDNLRVGHEAGNTNVMLAGQKGIPRPNLSPPTVEPNALGYEATMGSMDKMVSDWSTNRQALYNDLQKAGPPARTMPGGNIALSSEVSETSNGYQGTLDGKGFKVDVAGNHMQFMSEGKQIDVQFGDNFKIQSATADGVPMEFGVDETKGMSDLFMLMALFHEMGVEQRQMSRQGRNLANESVVQKIKSQAQEQRNAAAAKLVAGCVSGAVKVTSGMLTMAGSMKGMKADQATGGNGRVGDMIAQQWSAMGKMVEGLGEAGSSMLHYKAGLHEARSTELRAEEEQARFVKTTEQDQMQVAHELATKARDTFQQMYSQWLQSQSKTIGNI